MYIYGSHPFKQLKQPAWRILKDQASSLPHTSHQPPYTQYTSVALGQDTTHSTTQPICFARDRSGHFACHLSACIEMISSSLFINPSLAPDLPIYDSGCSSCPRMEQATPMRLVENSRPASNAAPDLTQYPVNKGTGFGHRRITTPCLDLASLAHIHPTRNVKSMAQTTPLHSSSPSY